MVEISNQKKKIIQNDPKRIARQPEWAGPKIVRTRIGWPENQVVDTIN